MTHVYRRRGLDRTPIADGIRRGIAHMQSQMLFADVMREVAELAQKRESEPPPEPEPAS